MSKTQEHENRIVAIRKRCDDLGRLTPSDFAPVQQDGNRIVLDNVDLPLTASLELIRELSQRDLSTIGENQSISLSNVLDALTSCLETARGLSVRNVELATRRLDVSKRIWDVHSELVGVAAIVIAATSLQAPLAKSASEEIQGLLERAQAAADEQRNSLDHVRSEAKQILEGLRVQAAEAGVAQTSTAFAEEANRHWWAGLRWLIATLLLLLLTVSGAAAAVYHALVFVPVSTAQVVQIGIAKIVGISVLTYGLIWAAKNHRAHSHNYTLNRHRANALQTFQSFMSGTADVPTKNAVLATAAGAAFNPLPTGFEDSGSDQSGTPLQLLNVVERSVAKSDQQ